MFVKKGKKLCLRNQEHRLFIVLKNLIPANLVRASSIKGSSRLFRASVVVLTFQFDKQTQFKTKNASSIFVGFSVRRFGGHHHCKISLLKRF